MSWSMYLEKVAFKGEIICMPKPQINTYMGIKWWPKEWTLWRKRLILAVNNFIRVELPSFASVVAELLYNQSFTKKCVVLKTFLQHSRQNTL